MTPFSARGSHKPDKRREKFQANMTVSQHELTWTDSSGIFRACSERRVRSCHLALMRRRPLRSTKRHAASTRLSCPVSPTLARDPSRDISSLPLTIYRAVQGAAKTRLEPRGVRATHIRSDLVVSERVSRVPCVHIVNIVMSCIILFIMKVKLNSMGKQGAFSSITLTLFVVGLLVGAGGGYLVSSSPLKTQINELEAEIGDLTSEASALYSNITLLENQKAEYEDRIQSLESLNLDYESQISILEGEKSNYESQISDLMDENEAYESQVSQLRSSLNTYIDTVSSLHIQLFDKDKHIEDLESMIYPKSGYEKFAAYGFSFEYPAYMYLTISGLLELNANEDSGMVIVTKVDESQLCLVGWVAPAYPRDIDLALEEGFTNMEQENVVLGQKVTSTFEGHEIKYQSYRVEIEARSYRGVLSYWNCDVDERVYTVNYLILGDVDPIPLFSEFLESFICHSSNK